MNNLRTIALLTAAILGLGAPVAAQQADSTRTGAARPMPMMMSGDDGAGHVLRHRDRLELTEEQVRALQELEEEVRAERRTAMKRMREAHEAMRTAAAQEREQVKKLLRPEQRERLTKMMGASSMQDCPMRNRGPGAEPDSTSPAGGGT